MKNQKQLIRKEEQRSQSESTDSPSVKMTVVPRESSSEEECGKMFFRPAHHVASVSGRVEKQVTGEETLYGSVLSTPATNHTGGFWASMTQQNDW